MISASRILDYVVEILEAASRPLVAREICYELLRKGISIERTKLNQILWHQNNRAGLEVDKATFKWRYDVAIAKQAEEAKQRKEEIKKEVAKQAAFLEFWENIGFEFIGVRRKGTAKPFFYLRENNDQHLLIGPEGNLLLEKASLCSKPESLSPEEFTLDQIKKAAEAILKDRCQKAIANTREIITRLRETELLSDEVYRGPVMVRIEDDDVIPASGVIFVANVLKLESCTVTLGLETVFQPLYLVINTLGFGMEADTRYGVFKICAYELIKQGLIDESEGDLNLVVTLEADGVSIGSGKNTLYLESVRKPESEAPIAYTFLAHPIVGGKVRLRRPR